MKYKYKKLRIDDRLIDEHRYIMEQFLDRKLDKNEVVHHIDGNKLNNDISNLEVMSLSDHSRLHMTGKKLSNYTKNKMRENNINKPPKSAKLSKNDIVDIRIRLSNGDSSSSISRDYGVHRAQISRIKNKISWVYVD